MRSRNYFITTIFGAIFAVSLSLLVSCAAPARTATEVVSPPDAREARTENIASQAGAGELVSAIREPDAVQGMPLQEGLTLLKTHCTMCHVPEWLSQIEKSPAEWERVLERMKSLGVQLSDTEKDILLDYLAVADKP